MPGLIKEQINLIGKQEKCAKGINFGDSTNTQANIPHETNNDGNIAGVDNHRNAQDINGDDEEHYQGLMEDGAYNTDNEDQDDNDDSDGDVQLATPPTR